MNHNPELAPRSTGLLALAIVMIVAAVLFVGMTTCSGISLLLTPMLGALPGAEAGAQATSAMMDDPLVMANTLAGLLFPTLLNILALVAAMGILKQRRWGRSLAMGFAIANLAWWAVSIPVNLLFIQPRLRAAMAGLPGAELASSAAMQIGGTLLGAVLYNALPVAILIVLTRPAIRRQFPV